MSSISTPTETLIDLLPASDFNGRKVKVHWKDSKTSHPSVAVCRGPGDKGQIVVEVSGTGQGKKTFQVAAKRVEPWWSQNPDLKDKRDKILLGSRTPGSMAEAIDKAALSSAAGEAREPAPKRKAVVLSVPAPVVSQAPSADRPAESLRPAVEAVAPVAPPPPQVETQPAVEEPPQEALAPAATPTKVAPARYDYQNFHGVTATVSADPTWPTDFAELQATFAAIRQEEEKIAELTRSIDEKRDMLALLSQELEKKGVTLLWNTPPERVVGAKDTDLLGQVERWVANAPASFTYAVAAEALGVIDNTLFRSYLKRAAGMLGYTMRKSLGYQSPMVFQRNEPDA